MHPIIHSFSLQVQIRVFLLNELIQLNHFHEVQPREEMGYIEDVYYNCTSFVN